MAGGINLIYCLETKSDNIGFYHALYFGIRTLQSLIDLRKPRYCVSQSIIEGFCSLSLSSN